MLRPLTRVLISQKMLSSYLKALDRYGTSKSLTFCNSHQSTCAGLIRWTSINHLHHPRLTRRTHSEGTDPDRNPQDQQAPHADRADNKTTDPQKDSEL
ncbi:Hypothetical predicted protein [Pelobates cultripes]|uniref:Uncharacterized protein n=1 Tax=Pelobates cultripes TaxID=61616 RepID=A0AAD1W9L1_PELCU|nr:Hypothetical predicted protein [Pelobates cultripes]